MFARALIAFLAMPGMVAFALPLLWLSRAGHGRLLHPAGLALLVLGIVGLGWCVRDFYVVGKGTLAPWAPPRRLVVVGLYRWSRNPMYLSVLLVLAGWSTAFESGALFAYGMGIAVAFELRVVFGEEPWLARTHGEPWASYARRVRRWL